MDDNDGRLPPHLVPGGTYFFAHALLKRGDNDLLVRHIEFLRNAVRRIKCTHPFHIHAWVVLPDHMYCVIELPAGDTDYATRWQLIKLIFSRSLPAQEPRTLVRQGRRERGIWQRRYWEHLIRDAEDLRRHLDYVHINPLKHGVVERVRDWPYSTFHRQVAQGFYLQDWAGGPQTDQTDKPIGGDL